MSTISFNIVDKVQSLPKKSNIKNSTNNNTTKTKLAQKNGKNKKVSKGDNRKLSSPENYDDDDDDDNDNETEDEEEDITDNDEDNEDEDKTQPMSEAGRNEVITDVLALLDEVITLSTDIYKESNGNTEDVNERDEEKGNDDENGFNVEKSVDNIKTEELDFEPFNSRLSKRKLRNNDDTDKLKTTKKSNIDFLLQPNKNKMTSKDKIDEENLDSDSSITLEEIGKVMPINSKVKDQIYRNIDELVERNERILRRRSAKVKTVSNKK